MVFLSRLEGQKRAGAAEEHPARTALHPSLSGYDNFNNPKLIQVK
jgi:hypothetical protein